MHICNIHLCTACRSSHLSSFHLPVSYSQLRGGNSKLRVETRRSMDWTEGGGEGLQAVYNWRSGGLDAL